MTMSNVKLKYDLSEAEVRDGSYAYITVYAWCPERGEEKYDGVSITTNGYGAGEFVEDKNGGYRQITGTCQYSLPLSASGIRKQLREMYIGRDESKSEEEDMQRWTETHYDELMADIYNDYDMFYGD